jgi:hypothetical protein
MNYDHPKISFQLFKEMNNNSAERPSGIENLQFSAITCIQTSDVYSQFFIQANLVSHICHISINLCGK